jgi:hypothetical protein
MELPNDSTLTYIENIPKTYSPTGNLLFFMEFSNDSTTTNIKNIPKKYSRTGNFLYFMEFSNDSTTTNISTLALPGWTRGNGTANDLCSVKLSCGCLLQHNKTQNVLKKSVP